MTPSSLPLVSAVNDFNWIAGHCFKELVWHECSWEFVFDRAACLTAACLWRLIENGRIRLTSQDDGHQFGLPAPLDAVRVVNEGIAGANASSVILRSGTLDLEIGFENGYTLQFIPDSCGYESWAAQDAARQFIAAGGGKLWVIDEPTGHDGRS
jgi:hypothetical protein